MSWRYLDRVDGIAIDNQDTRAHHQIISLDQEEQTLQYTVFYEPLQKSQPKPRISYSFIDDMNAETPLDVQGQTYLTQQYNNFFEAIRPHGKSYGFQMKELAKALTFDIKFNQDLQMVGMTYRPTLGYMVKKITYQSAAKQMHKSDDLKMIHDIAFNSFSNKKKKNVPQKTEIPFEEVVSRVGLYVREQKLEIDFMKNMDCIFRSDENLSLSSKEMEKLRKMEIPEWADYLARYHSIRDRLSMIDDEDDYILPRKSVIPTTASRENIDHYNIMASAETLVTGETPFDPGTSTAIANFKKHQLVWQRLGMTQQRFSL